MSSSTISIMISALPIPCWKHNDVLNHKTFTIYGRTRMVWSSPCSLSPYVDDLPSYAVVGAISSYTADLFLPETLLLSQHLRNDWPAQITLVAAYVAVNAASNPLPRRDHDRLFSQ